jgi:hypothetical protein
MNEEYLAEAERMLQTHDLPALMEIRESLENADIKEELLAETKELLEMIKEKISILTK